LFLFISEIFRKLPVYGKLKTEPDKMTTVTIDLDSFGSMIAGLLSILVGLYAYLNQKGYIQKWLTKLSLDDDVAKIATATSESALFKLNIPDELIAVFKETATDPDGGIDAQKIIDILSDRTILEKILGSDKPLTKEEKEQINSIMIRAMKAYKKARTMPSDPAPVASAENNLQK
jgi:hypothetical protein